MLLVLSLLAIPMVPASAAFSDVAGHWAGESIGRWEGSGVIQGYEGRFRPDDPVTRGEFAIILNRVFGYQGLSATLFADVAADAFYADAISKVCAAGIMVGDSGKFRPLDPVSRQEVAVALARAFLLATTNANAVNKFSDASTIAAWAKNSCSALVERNYLAGRPNNLFEPLANITRAEIIVILDRMIKAYIHKAGMTTGSFIVGNVVVNANGASLKGTTVVGDVYVTQGVAEGTATLEGVLVQGTVYVMGGGENSVIIKDSRISNMVIIKENDRIRIVATGSTEIDQLLARSGAILEEKSLTGNGFEGITISDTGAITLMGLFDNLSIEVPGAAVNIPASSVVTSFAANSPVEVTGSGRIVHATVNGGMTSTISPDIVRVAAGKTATINGIGIGEKHVTLMTSMGSLHAPVAANKASFTVNMSTMANVMLTQAGIFGYPASATMNVTEILSTNVQLKKGQPPDIDATLDGLESILPVDLLGGDIFLRSILAPGISGRVLYEIFGASIHVFATLDGTPVTLEINCTNGVSNAYYAVDELYRQPPSYTHYVIRTRILQSGASVSSVGIMNLLTYVFGSAPAKVVVGSATFTAPFDAAKIQALQNAVGAVTLGDLVTQYPDSGTAFIGLYKNADDVYPVFMVKFVK